MLTDERIEYVVSLIPGEWLIADGEGSPENKRDMYKKFLQTRLTASGIIVKEANYARQSLI
jgi:hypothetical protein